MLAQLDSIAIESDFHLSLGDLAAAVAELFPHGPRHEAIHKVIPWLPENQYVQCSLDPSVHRHVQLGSGMGLRQSAAIANFVFYNCADRYVLRHILRVWLQHLLLLPFLRRPFVLCIVSKRFCGYFMPFYKHGFVAFSKSNVSPFLVLEWRCSAPTFSKPATECIIAPIASNRQRRWLHPPLTFHVANPLDEIDSAYVLKSSGYPSLPDHVVQPLCQVVCSRMVGVGP